jgi:hypothetical protein
MKLRKPERRRLRGSRLVVVCDNNSVRGWSRRGGLDGDK